MQKIDKITPQIAAFYLGAKCEYSDNEGTKTFAILSGVSSDGIETTFKRKKNGVCGDIIPWSQRTPRQKCFAGVLVLHLRRLESITEEEAREIYQISKSEPWEARMEWMEEDDEDRSALRYYWNNTDEWYTDEKNMEIGRPLVWIWLLGKRFDLFGLIDSGLAKEIK